MDINLNSLGMMIILFLLLVLFFINKSNNKKIDSRKDYGKENLGGRIVNKDGITLLFISYKRGVEKNKLAYILENYKQGTEISSENGDKYIISNLLNKEYYDQEDEKILIKCLRKDPCVEFKLISIMEFKQSGIYVDRTTGPVLINIGDGDVFQNNSNNEFLDYLSNNKEYLVRNGIEEKDIDSVVSNPSSKNKKTFLSKYKIELASLIIDFGEFTMSILEYLGRKS